MRWVELVYDLHSTVCVKCILSLFWLFSGGGVQFPAGRVCGEAAGLCGLDPGEFQALAVLPHLGSEPPHLTWAEAQEQVWRSRRIIFSIFHYVFISVYHT